jgi:hypothetical protein
LNENQIISVLFPISKLIGSAVPTSSQTPLFCGKTDYCEKQSQQMADREEMRGKEE